MKPVTTRTAIGRPSRIETVPHRTRLASITPLPARPRSRKDLWLLVVMVSSLCLFTSLLWRDILQPASETMAGSIDAAQGSEGP